MSQTKLEEVQMEERANQSLPRSKERKPADVTTSEFKSYLPIISLSSYQPDQRLLDQALGAEDS